LLQSGNDVAHESNAALFNMEYEPTFRAYAMGQFSKFVRPGFQRIGTSDPSGPSPRTLAFLSENSERLVLVALNEGDSAKTVDIALPAELRADQAQYWLTDADHQLEQLTPLAVKDAPPTAPGVEDPITTPYFTVELRKQSIATFVLDEPRHNPGTGGHEGKGGEGNGMSGDGDGPVAIGGQSGSGPGGASMSEP
jgi:hypothetical protein